VKEKFANLNLLMEAVLKPGWYQRTLQHRYHYFKQGKHHGLILRLEMFHSQCK